MLKIAICEDEIWMQKYLQTLIEGRFLVQVDLYESGEALLAAKTEYDIFLLDICLENPVKAGKINGLQTAEKLREKSTAIIIFITALKEYVYEAYDVEAFHYLLKPIDEEKLIEVMQKAVSKIEKRKSAIPLRIKVKGTHIQIPVEDIVYAENDARKIILHTQKEVFSYYEKMENLEKSLGSNFFRCHRGYLVHLQEVAGYDHTSITLRNGETIYLAKQKYNAFVTAYMKYLAR